MPSESTRIAKLEATPIAPSTLLQGNAMPVIATDSAWNHVVLLLLHNWVTVAVIALVAVLATGAWLLRAVPIYEASARVQINGQAPDFATLKDATAASIDDSELLNTYVAIIESDDLAEKAIGQLGLAHLPEFAPAQGPSPSGDVVSVFSRHLSVSRVPDTKLVEIRFDSQDPTLAAKVANTLASELIDFELQQNYNSATKATSWLDTELQSLQAEVEQADHNLVDYEQANHIINVDDRQTITTQKLSQLNQDLTAAIADRIQKQAAYNAVLNAESGGSGNAADTSPGTLDNADPLLPQLRQQRAEAQASLAQLEAQFGINYPQVQQARQKGAALDAAIQAELQRQFARLQQSYLAAADRERLLSDAVRLQTAQFNDLSQKMVQYEILKRQADSKHQLYDGLLQKQREAAVSAGITSSHISIVDPANVPLRPARPRRGLDLAMSLFVGLLLGAAFVMAREQWDRTVRLPEDLDWLGARPLLGLIPRFDGPQAGDSRGATTAVRGAGLVRKRSVELEAYRSIRTTLQLSTSDRPGRVIAVTSAMPGEGKSTCTANLAYAYAQTGERVLIIDCDLRRPSQHLGFATKRGPGLAEVLLGEIGPQQAIVRTALPDLFLLPVGRRVSNPSELLQSNAFAELVRSLQADFDRIFVDCTPVLGLSDGLLGTAVADTQLFLVRSGATPKAAVRSVLAIFRQVNLELAGFVLNDISSEAGYGYYGHYQDYSAYHDSVDLDGDESAPALPARRN